VSRCCDDRHKDSAGNVYVTDGLGSLFELPTGSTTQVEPPFTETGINILSNPQGVVVDSAANVYVASAKMANNASNNGVFELPAGSNTAVESLHRLEKTCGRGSGFRRQCLRRRRLH
jgi:DNA-binding beta-propeller fold protein YncE